MVDLFRSMLGSWKGWSTCLGAWVLVLATQSAAHAELRGDLTVEIQGLDSQSGQVCMTLFGSSQGFPNDLNRAISGQCIDITGRPLSFVFRGLPYGSYAVAAYHDRNDDRQLNQGAFGIPVEGIAFSNDAPLRMGPARYQDAVFFLSQTNARIQIQMRYLRPVTQ